MSELQAGGIVWVRGVVESVGHDDAQVIVGGSVRLPLLQRELLREGSCPPWMQEVEAHIDSANIWEDPHPATDACDDSCVQLYVPVPIPESETDADDTRCKRCDSAVCVCGDLSDVGRGRDRWGWPL